MNDSLATLPPGARDPSGRCSAPPCLEYKSEPARVFFSADKAGGIKRRVHVPGLCRAFVCSGTIHKNAMHRFGVRLRASPGDLPAFRDRHCHRILRSFPGWRCHAIGRHKLIAAQLQQASPFESLVSRANSIIALPSVSRREPSRANACDRNGSTNSCAGPGLLQRPRSRRHSRLPPKF